MVYQTLKEMYNAASLGNAKPEPRWMQCVAQVQLNLGTALSNVYVKNQLTRADKEVVSVRKKGDKLTQQDNVNRLTIGNFITFHCTVSQLGRSTTLCWKLKKSSTKR